MLRAVFPQPIAWTNRTMKFVFFVVMLVAVASVPLVIEGAPNHCIALERLAAHRLLDVTDPKEKLDATTEKKVRALFKAGHVAEVIVARNYAMKTAIGCPIMYWQGLIDPETLRQPVLAMQ